MCVAVRFGGLPQRIVYDNLTAAVKRRVGLTTELTERFQALVSHYLFEPCFARPGKGHDEGRSGARIDYATLVSYSYSIAGVNLSRRE